MNINPEFMGESFNKNPVQYNLGKGDIIYLPPASSSCYGINSLAFREHYSWKRLPSDLKDIQSIFIH